MLTFEVADGREAAWQFISGAELMSLTANLGDAHMRNIAYAAASVSSLTAQQLRVFVHEITDTSRHASSLCKPAEYQLNIVAT